MPPHQCLGQLLIDAGLLTRQQLRAGLDAQLQFQGRLGTNLIELGLISEETLAWALGQQHGVPFASDEELRAISLECIGLLTLKAVRTYRCVPLRWTDDSRRTLRVATADPGDLRTLDDLRAVLNCRIEAVVVSELRLEDLLERHYGIRRSERMFIRVVTDLGDASVVPGRPERDHPSTGPLTDPTSSEETSVTRTVLTPPPLPGSGACSPSECPPTQASWNHPIIATRSFPLRPALSGLVAPTTAARSGPNDSVPIGSAREGLIDAIARSTSTIPPSSHTHTTKYALDIERRPAPVSAPAPPGELEWNFEDTTGVTRAGGLRTSAFLRTLEDLAATDDHDQAAERLLAYLSGRFECALIMLVRDDVAYGWKGYARSASQSAIESLVVPLTVPSMFQIAATRGRPFHGPPPEAGSRLQKRLWKSLNSEIPSEVLVTPVYVSSRLVNLIYAHPGPLRRVKPVAQANLAALASAAGLAYRRAIKRTAAG